MRTLCWSPFIVLVLVLSLVVGCLDDEEGFYSPGDLPGFAVPSGGNPDCKLEVDAPSPVRAAGPRFAIAGLPADGPAHVALDGSAGRAGFTSTTCENFVTGR